MVAVDLGVEVAPLREQGALALELGEVGGASLVGGVAVAVGAVDVGEHDEPVDDLREVVVLLVLGFAEEEPEELLEAVADALLAQARAMARVLAMLISPAMRESPTVGERDDQADELHVLVAVLPGPAEACRAARRRRRRTRRDGRACDDRARR